MLLDFGGIFMKNLRTWICLIALVCLPVFLMAAEKAEKPAKPDPKKELETMKIPFTADAFVKEAEKGNVKALELFLAAGMDINVPAEEDSRTVLIAASASTTPDVIKMLLAKGADVKRVDDDDTTALMVAARFGQADLAKILIENNSNVNASDIDDYTPLMLAAQSGSVEIVKMLLDKGADAFFTNDDDETAMDIAKQNKHQAIVEILAKVKPKAPQTQADDEDDDDE